MNIDKVRSALEMARDFHQHDSKMYAVIDGAIAELPASVEMAAKSAPEVLTSQHAETLPKREPAAAGADTRCSADTAELKQHEETFFRLIRALLTDVATAKLGVTSGRANDLLHKLKHLNELRQKVSVDVPQPAPVLDFFSQNVDAWGAAEWFDRLAKAVREQDAAVLAGDMMTMETCRNVASSSAMRLVRDFEPLVRAALSLSRPDGA